jgi:hypothetical protein
MTGQVIYKNINRLMMQLINHYPHSEYVPSHLNLDSMDVSFQPPSIVDTLKPADVHKMLIKEEDSVNMILEQVNLGRGRHWFVLIFYFIF